MDTPHSGAPPPQQSKQLVLRLSLQKLLVIVISLFIIALISGGVLVFLKQQRQQQAASIFSAQIRSQAHFPLYYPANLPGSFKTNEQSVRFGDNVVTFSIKNQQNDLLAVSEQAVPLGFNFTEFYKVNVELPQRTNVAQGTLTVGKFNGLPVCMLVTPTTWIIVNDPANAQSDKLKGICQGLKRTD